MTSSVDLRVIEDFLKDELPCLHHAIAVKRIDSNFLDAYLTMKTAFSEGESKDAVDIFRQELKEKLKAVAEKRKKKSATINNNNKVFLNIENRTPKHSVGSDFANTPKMEIIEEEEDFFNFEHVRKWSVEEELLSTTALFWCNRVGSKARTVGDIVVGKRDENVYSAIQDVVDRLNRKYTVSKIATWTILKRDATVDTGEVTLTGNVRRKRVGENVKAGIKNDFLLLS